MPGAVGERRARERARAPLGGFGPAFVGGLLNYCGHQNVGALPHPVVGGWVTGFAKATVRQKPLETL